jgi:hypothetical protein
MSAIMRRRRSLIGLSLIEGSCPEVRVWNPQSSGRDAHPVIACRSVAHANCHPLGIRTVGVDEHGNHSDPRHQFVEQLQVFCPHGVRGNADAGNVRAGSAVARYEAKLDRVTSILKTIGTVVVTGLTASTTGVDAATITATGRWMLVTFSLRSKFCAIQA